MAWWQWLIDVVGLLIALPLLLGMFFLARRHVLTRGGGTFDMSHRIRTTHPGRGWVLGLGRYRGQTLEWFRVFSLSPRPMRTWPRRELTYTGRRDPIGAETFALYEDHIVVICSTPSGVCEMAMEESSLMGFQAWLEAGPPGVDWDRPRHM